MFDYAIFVSDTCEGEGESESINGSFEIDFSISMYISELMDEPQDVADGVIRIFNIPNGTEELRFRNTDLNFNTTSIQGAQFELKESSIFIIGFQFKYLFAIKPFSFFWWKG